MKRPIVFVWLCLAVLAGGCAPVTPGPAVPTPAPAGPTTAPTGPTATPARATAGATAIPAGTTSATTPRSGGTLRYGLTLPVSGIDPQIHASSELGIALSGVYDTLVAQDQKGNFVPDLATSWTVSDDRREYTFKLRQDVKFHDGTPFNAAAVKRNLDRVADPATRSQKAVFLLGPYDHTEVIDPYTVKVALKQPFAPLLDGLSQVYLGMASPAALDKWGDQYQLHQVGTGPFRFVSFQEQRSLVIERNPDYNWAPSIRQHKGPAYLDRVEFTFYGDPATRLPALLSGQADVMDELPQQDFKQIAAQPAAYTPYTVPIPGQSVQFLLDTKAPPLDDLRVRQALLYGTDRAGLVSAVFGPSSPVAYGPLSSVTHGADPALNKLYPYDPARARTLLTEAGWTPGANGILAKNGQPLTMHGILESWGDLAQIGTILQAQWRTLGIDLQLEMMSYPAGLQAAHTNKYNLIPFSISGTDPSVLRSFFHSSNLGQFNLSNVSDPQIDTWLDQAQQVNDWTQRSALYAQVQERVMNQAWTLPIRDPVNLNASASRVQGLTFDVQGWFPVLYDTWLSK